MKQNLDALKDEILRTLEAEGFVVFRGAGPLLDSQPRVYWDSLHHPDFRSFLQVARRADVHIVIFSSREFTAEQLEEVKDSLEESELPVEEQQPLRRRLKALENYTGFTCALDLSFDYHGRSYLFELRAEWYEEFLEIADEVDIMSPGMDGLDEDDGGDMKDYFSRN